MADIDRMLMRTQELCWQAIKTERRLSRGIERSVEALL